MKPLQTKKTKGQTEEELRKQIKRRLIIILLIIGGGFLSLTFFAPSIGSIFSFLSKYRNVDDDTTITPNPPILTNVPNATKDRKIELTGYSRAGMTIKLYVNGPEKHKTTTGTDGLFTFDEVKLLKGRNTIFAKAVDAENIGSEKSQTYTIYVDSKSPDIDILSPNNGETIKNLDRRVEIKGRVNEKAVVKINDRIAIVRPDLTFEFLLGVDEGYTEINVKATDEAGNESEETITIKYERKSS